MLILIPVGCVIVVIAMVALLTLRRDKRLSPEVNADRLATPTLPASAEARDSVPSSSDGETRSARAIAPRESREIVLADRARSGLCRYCDEPAMFEAPEFSLVRSPFDALYRYLGVVPVQRWRIVTGLGAKPPALCEPHQEMVRGHMERRLVENAADYAAFVEKQRNEVFEFARHSMDEKISEDMQSIRQKRRGKRPAGVLSIADKKSSAG